MKTRKDIIREEAVRIMRFVQDEIRRQIKRGEDPQYADATHACMDGVCDMIGGCANEITANVTCDLHGEKTNG